MHIGRIVGATRDLGAPKGWDESKGKCLTLPVLRYKTTGDRIAAMPPPPSAYVAPDTDPA